MGALDFGMKEEELKSLVASWREANPKIVKYWWAVDAAIKKAIRTKQPVFFKNLIFSYTSGILFIQLPSGRSLAYPKPRIESNTWSFSRNWTMWMPSMVIWSERWSTR